MFFVHFYDASVTVISYIYAVVFIPVTWYIIVIHFGISSFGFVQSISNFFSLKHLNFNLYVT